MMTTHTSIPLTLALLLTLLADHAALAAPRPATPALKMDLLRRSGESRRSVMSNEEWMDWANGHREGLKAKYGDSSSSSTGAVGKRATSGTNKLINVDADSSYIGSLAVGTPPTAYNVILDTGSSDFWLASPACTTCGTTPTFTTTQSSTFNQVSTEFSVSYGSGAASGILGQDAVQMAGFEVPNQFFGVCGDVSQQFLSNPVSGLMGLGFQSIASSGAMPFWQTLAESSAWSEPVMAFSLTRFLNQSNVQALEPGGTFTMGATDSSLFTGTIEYTDIPSGKEGFWVLPMKTITVQGSSVSVPDTETDAAIDTGTTLIAGPSDVVTNVYAQIPGSAPVADAEGYFSYPCATEVNIALSFGGSSWSVSPTDFITRQLNRELCVGALFAIDLNGTTTPDFIVGDTFLKNVYSAFRFNPPSVGFAELSATALAQANTASTVASPTTVVAPVIVSATASLRNGGELSSSAAVPLVLGARGAGTWTGVGVAVLAGLFGALLA